MGPGSLSSHDLQHHWDSPHRSRGMWKALARARLSTHPVNRRTVDLSLWPFSILTLGGSYFSFYSVLAFLGYLGKNLVFQLSPVFLS